MASVIRGESDYSSVEGATVLVTTGLGDGDIMGVVRLAEQDDATRRNIGMLALMVEHAMARYFQESKPTDVDFDTAQICLEETP